MGAPRSLSHVDASARLGDRDLDQQMTDQGILAVAVGICLALTGPTTPSFRLFAILPAWPVLWGFVVLLLGASLLVCRTRGQGLRLGQMSLVALGSMHLAAGALLFATWAIWRWNPGDGSEPLLAASPVLLYLAVRCGRVWWANVLRQRRGIGAACGS